MSIYHASKSNRDAQIGRAALNWLLTGPSEAAWDNMNFAKINKNRREKTEAAPPICVLGGTLTRERRVLAATASAS